MTTMNVSLPDSMKAFVDEQVASKGYGSSSEYIRDLLRKEQDRERLGALLLAGLESGPPRTADADYFADLRARVTRRTTAKAAKASDAVRKHTKTASR